MKSMKTVAVFSMFLFFLTILWAPVVFAESTKTKTYKIGASVPLNSSLGVEAKKMWELLIPMFNDEGGVTVKGEKYHLEMIIYDDKYTAEGGKAAGERLVYRDKVNMIFSLGSTPTLGLISVTDPEGVLVISTGGTPKLLNPAYKWVWSRMQNGAGIQESTYAYISENYPKVKTLASLISDDEVGRDCCDQDIRIGGKFGLKHIGKVTYPRGTTDFSPMAASIKKMNPDMVAFCGVSGGAELGVQIKALWESGWRGLRYSSQAIRVKEFMQTINKEQAEGILSGFISMGDSDNPNALAAKLKKAYIDKYGDWLSTGFTWVMPFHVWVEGVKKADSLEAKDIIKVLPGMRCETIEGPVQVIPRIDVGVFNRYGLLAGHDLGIIRDGKLVSAIRYSLDETIKAFEKVYDASVSVKK